MGLSVGMSSCDRQPVVPRDAVARVGSVYLTRSGMESSLPVSAAGQDSLEQAKQRLRAWAGHQILLQKARENLGKEVADIVDRQTKEYEESLYIYFYEEQLTKKLLDTLVSDKEIEAYYEANREQFVLKNDIVRLRFVKLPESSKSASRIKDFLFSDTLGMEDLSVLADLCSKESENYYLDGDSWLFFSDVLREVPIQYDPQDFLRGNRHVSLESGGFLYYVSILEFKVKDMVSPLSFERERIKNIILNLRKKELLRQAEKELMDEAERSGVGELY